MKGGSRDQDGKREGARMRPYVGGIIDTIREPFLVLDEQFNIVLANNAFYQTFATTAQETLDKSVFDLGDRQWDILELRRALEGILLQKNSFNDFEVFHVFPGIGPRTVLLNAREVVDQEARQKLILLAMEDVTEHRMVEGELKEYEMRFRRLFETAGDGLLLVDREDGRITNVNQALVELLGYSQEEFLGKSLKDFGIIHYEGCFREVARKLTDVELMRLVDVQLSTKDGRAIDVDVSLTDRTTLIQCNIRDVTERKQMLKRLLSYAENMKSLVDERTRELDLVRADLIAASKLAALGRLGAGISHQLNSPLGGAMLLVDALVDLCREETQKEIVGKLRHALGDMHHIIDGLLSLAGTVRPGQSTATPVDVNDIVRRAIDIAGGEIAIHGIGVETALDPSPLAIAVHLGELDQIFLNLINNAIDAMQDGGTLSINSKAVPNGIEVRVRDSGGGIHPEHLERIFEPFFTTRRGRRGIGLGLSIVHQIVEKYGGRISAKSEVGHGTEFLVFLPRHGANEQK